MAKAAIFSRACRPRGTRLAGLPPSSWAVQRPIQLGLWMAWRPGRAAYAAALLLMAVMTALATVIQPSLWLHPLGPLLKNLPIAAILWVLLQGTSHGTR